MTDHRFKSGTIGVLLDVVGDYYTPILNGIRSQAEAAGLSVLIFVGRQLNPVQLHDAPANDTYRLIPQDLIGLVAFTSAIGHHVTDEHIRAFLDGFAPLPIVGIARDLPGVPAILVDNTSGMRELVTHLVVERGYRRLAFVRGTDGSPESLEREQAFCDVLRAHGIRVRPELMITGDFWHIPAYNATVQLLDQGHTFDAIVSANDEMVNGITRALQERNLHVPDDVAVTGFDDLQQSQFTSPPLTTVRQPLFDQGAEAVRLLLRRANREDVSSVRLPTRLVVRASCGSEVFPNLKSLPASGASDASETNADVQRAAFARATAPLEILSDQQSAQLFDAIVQDALSPGGGRAFLPMWRTMMRRVARKEPWVSMLEQLRDCALKCLSERSAIEHLLATWGQARIVLDEFSLIEHTRRVLGEQYDFDGLRQLERTLMVASDLSELLACIPPQLARLGISRCFVGLYSSFEAHAAQTAQIVLAHDRDQPIQPDESVFPSRELLPASMRSQLRRGAMFIHPLFTADVHYGYILTDATGDAHRNHEALRTLISDSLHNMTQTTALKSYAASLEGRIRQRTEELENTNNLLKDEIIQRRTAEVSLLEANNQLRQMTLTDGLTGVNNRSAFDEYLERQWGHHHRHQRPLSLLMCDIDYFKRFNDSYGHVQGDECLRAVARALQAGASRSGDMVARYGGEEFAIILIETDAAGADRVAVRLHEIINRLGIPHAASDVAATVTLSIGVSTIVPNVTYTTKTLIEAADRALYRAKNAGRNQFVRGHVSTNQIS